MKIWAIADLHLSFGVPNKKMDVFGTQWINHGDTIAKNWSQIVGQEDLVLIPGDISWALTIDEARPDLEWIEKLPGTKIMIKGNHDLWWNSLSKVKKILPPSCHVIQNNSWTKNGVSIAGTRLWDIPGLSFKEYIAIQDVAALAKEGERIEEEETRKIYQRELGRLETSLKELDPNATTKIAMTHYPPIGPDFKETEVSLLFEKYGVNISVFGHLHNIKPNVELFGTHHGIHYSLVACDYLHRFSPLLVSEGVL